MFYREAKKIHDEEPDPIYPTIHHQSHLDREQSNRKSDTPISHHKSSYFVVHPVHVDIQREERGNGHRVRRFLNRQRRDGCDLVEDPENIDTQVLS